MCESIYESQEFLSSHFKKVLYACLHALPASQEEEEDLLFGIIKTQSSQYEKREKQHMKSVIDVRACM